MAVGIVRLGSKGMAFRVPIYSQHSTGVFNRVYVLGCESVCWVEEKGYLGAWVGAEGGPTFSTGGRGGLVVFFKQEEVKFPGSYFGI